MKALWMVAALFAASPALALAAVECNTTPNSGDYRIRFSTEKSGYAVTQLHQDWIEKKTGKVSRRTSTVVYLRASQESISIRTLPYPKEGQRHPSYVEINAAPGGAGLKGEAKWWGFRVKQEDLLPRWHLEGLDELNCIVD